MLDVFYRERLNKLFPSLFYEWEAKTCFNKVHATTRRQFTGQDNGILAAEQWTRIMLLVFSIEDCLVLRWDVTVWLLSVLSEAGLCYNFSRYSLSLSLSLSLSPLFWLPVHKESPARRECDLPVPPRLRLFHTTTNMRRLLVQLIKGCRGRHKSEFSLYILS